ncbi:hypothetical protein BM534_21595, partial [Clostridioides difficile]
AFMWFFYCNKGGLGFVKGYIEKVVAVYFSNVFIIFIVFYMARLAPGDPLISYYGDGVERMSTQEKRKCYE